MKTAVHVVTGMRQTVSDTIGPMTAMIRAHTDLPIAVGFGVRSPAQAAAAVCAADGAVVASALIDTLAASLDSHGRAAPDTVRRVLDQVRELAAGVRAARMHKGEAA